MTPFSHSFPQQQVVFGRGIASDLCQRLVQLGLERPFLVCSPRARAGGDVRAIAKRMPSGSIRVWDGVVSHAPLQAAVAGAQAARSHGADVIVSFGGGSASDLAKGIALALAEGSQIESFALRREPGSVAARVSIAPKLPIVALPTTLSGAEVTPGFSLTRDDAYKLIFRDHALAARLVVLDPLLIAEVSDYVLVGSGMNALAHCFEALYSKARTPFSSVLAAEGLRCLWSGLQQRLNGSDSADELMVGAYLAGSAIVNARTALHHAICHKLAPLARLSHGEANTAMLPHVLRFNLSACPAEARVMAQAMELGAEIKPEIGIASTITAHLCNIARRAGLPTRLRDFSLERSQLDGLAERVFAEPGLAFNPRPIESTGQIGEILDRAW